MKKNIIAVGVVAFFILNTVAFALVGGMTFVDQNKFADWNSSAIDHLQKEGIVKGYGDGSFKPDNNVTRAEMAVMMDRMYARLVGKMGKTLENYEDLKNLAFTDNGMGKNTAKIALAMGMSHLSETKFDPNAKENKVNCDKLTGKNIPINYEIYECASLPTSIYYVHEFGNVVVPEGDGGTVDLNSWYGPFEPSAWFLND